MFWPLLLAFYPSAELISGKTGIGRKEALTSCGGGGLYITIMEGTEDLIFLRGSVSILS